MSGSKVFVIADLHHNSRDDAFRWNGVGVAPTARGRGDGNGDIRGSMCSSAACGRVLDEADREDAILARARRRSGIDGGGDAC